MAVQNATAVTLSVGGEVMAHATSASFSISRDLRDKTSKASGGWQENLEGLMSWEMSGDAFVDIEDVDASMSDCFSLLVTGAKVAVVFEVGASGDTYDGDAFITSVSADAGVEENATFSLSLTGTGVLGFTAKV